MRALLVALVVLGSLAAGPPAAAGPSATVQSDMVGAINAYRAASGLGGLSYSSSLTAAAQWMANDMATRNYFSHTSLDGRSPQQRMAAFGYPAFVTWTGEDLAAGNSSVGATLVQWETSASHNAVLLSGYARAVGIGVAYNPNSTYKWYWAADFGGIGEGAPAPAPAPQTPQTGGASSGSGTDSAPSNVAADAGYHAAFVEQSSPLSLPPGEIGTFAIAFRNTGARAWVRGSDEARLGTREPLDQAFPELAVDWPSTSRPAAQSTSRVEPGEVGWFFFRLHAPQSSGTYVVRVRPVIDGVAWLDDVGAYFEFRVALVPLLVAI